MSAGVTPVTGVPAATVCANVISMGTTLAGLRRAGATYARPDDPALRPRYRETGRTSSAIEALNLSASSANGS